MTARQASAVLAILFVSPAGAGDPEAGRTLYLLGDGGDLPCSACHDEAWFRDPSNRTAESLLALRGWVRGCSLEFPQGWFPEDEDDVASWLNDSYYGFPAD